MNDRFERLMAVFAAARAESDPQARERLLVAQCAGDESLLREARELLAQEREAERLDPEFLDPVDGIRGAGAGAEPHEEELGEFVLLERIDSGSCGVVWRAHQPSLGRDVALKVMTAGPGTPAGLVERFHREPMLAAALNHPHIVPVYAEGRRGDTHWFAMQLVEGHSLAEELHRQEAMAKAVAKPNAKAAARRALRKTLLPNCESGAWFAAVAKVCADTADALQAAHEEGIVHRDIKPQNLLLDPRGHVLVADFGIARDQRLGSLTDPGIIAGTLHYMSPEQARIEDIAVDHRTDVYSLGVVLYELLTRARPFEGQTSAEIYDSIRYQAVQPVRRRNPRVPRDLATICEAAMERAADQRYASAGELRDDLRRFLNHEAIERQPPSRWAQLAAGLRRRRRALTLVASMVLVAVGGFYLNHAMAAGRERSDLERRCHGMLAHEDLATVDVAELSGLRRQLARFEESSPVLHAARTRLAAYRGRVLAEIRASFAVGADEPLAARKSAALRGFFLAHRAGQVFPGDAEVTRAMPADPMTARVEVVVLGADGAARDAQVFVRAIDPLTGMPGEARRLTGTASLGEGLYRFVVAHGPGPRQEFLRKVVAMARTTLRLPLAEGAQTDGMVRLGGQLQLPADSQPHGLSGRSVRVDPFWLDRREVTVAEYGAFLAATGRRPPATWDLFDREACADRPVVGVSWGDAVAFAEWCGKRLPTYAEWALAAHGPGAQPRAVPWQLVAPAGVAAMRGNCKQPIDFDLTLESRMDAYARRVLPANADPTSATPDGVSDMFGNVAEWTASPGVDLAAYRTTLVARPDHRIVAGHAWYTMVQNPDASLLQTSLAPAGAAHASFDRGFRCARSVTP